VMVFIDGSNLYHALEDFVGRTDLDLQQDRSGELVEKGVDVSLAVDMLSRDCRITTT